MRHILKYHGTPSVLNRQYDETAGTANDVKAYTQRPATNIFSTEEAVKLEIAAPGFTRDEIHISVDENILKITAEHKDDAKKDSKYLSREFYNSKLQRSFELAKSVEIEKIEAKHENGVLTIILPKKEKMQIKIV
ncbi:MAG: Hsp20/alpha crystallin family protein [Bacteroidales bacterium]|nr:Hsp20/alpha crystallin family protein [Bacteroidales bacterium]